jgi:hypothetical protein
MRAGYTQAIAGFAPVTSKTLVNSRSNKVVNIASTKMMNAQGTQAWPEDVLPSAACAAASRAIGTR